MTSCRRWLVGVRLGLLPKSSRGKELKLTLEDVLVSPLLRDGLPGESKRVGSELDGPKPSRRGLLHYTKRERGKRLNGRRLTRWLACFEQRRRTRTRLRLRRPLPPLLSAVRRIPRLPELYKMILRRPLLRLPSRHPSKQLSNRSRRRLLCSALLSASNTARKCN